MYLVSRFRQAGFAHSPRLRILPAPLPAVARYQGGEDPVPAPLEDARRPQLHCAWEESGRAEVRLGDQCFRGPDLLMHWMPVH